MSTHQFILLLIPLGLIEIVLIVVALRDWARRTSFRLLPRLAWLAVILLVSTVGPIVYLALGRGEEPEDTSGDER